MEIPESLKWSIKQYKNDLSLILEGSDKYQRFINNIPELNSANTNSITQIKRIMGNFTSLKSNYLLDFNGYTCMTMVASLDDVVCQYSMAYYKDEELPDFICLGSTYLSQDGEYRGYFKKMMNFMKNYQSQDADIYEKIVLYLIHNHGLVLDLYVYPEEEADKVTEKANNHRIAVIALAFMIRRDAYKYDNLPEHQSKSYKKLLKLIIDKCSEIPLKPIKNVKFKLRCGQKIIPMFNREVYEPYDYNLSCWREYLMTKLASDLVINFISPSFAIYNGWTYIEGCNSSLFENPSMILAYERSESTKMAAMTLRSARKEISQIQTNYHTEMLSAHVYDSLEYAQNHLLLSDICILHTMEHVGDTFASFHKRYINMAIKQSMDVMNPFKDKGNMCARIFELAYGAHCLHEKIGIIHSDLHGNNMTIFQWVSEKKRQLYTNPTAIYVAGSRGEADTYLFPAMGLTSIIIDYSRGIMGPAMRPYLDDHKPKRYVDSLYRDQINRIMRTFHRYEPKYVAEHQDAIKAAVIGNFESAFAVLACVDYIAIGTAVAAMTFDDEFHVHPDGIKLAKNLEIVAREKFIIGLQELVRAKTNIAFSGTAIFERVFSEFRFPKAYNTSMQAVDAFNFNIPVKYHGGDYTHWPKWARVEEVEQHLGDKYKITDVFNTNISTFIGSLRPNIKVEAIAAQLRVEQEKLDGEPVAVQSSWIE